MSHEYEIGDEIFENMLVIGKFGGENKSGFGVVYLIFDKNTGSTLALKTLQNEKISLTEFEEFKNEVIPWVNFSNHPNIVKAFSIDLADDNRPYLLMEPIFPDEDGKQNLTDFMDINLSEMQILKWCIQFCYAMEYVSNQGYFHGDIKPDNILISNNSVKITDFGLARPIDNKTKNYNGTIFYLAPESWKGIKNVKSDIYAFGIVMYQMINCGKLPYNGISEAQWENFHKNGKIPECDSILYPLIEKCLEKNPNKRYSSFNELNNDLIKILDEKYKQKIEKPKLEDIGNIKNMAHGHLAAVFNDIENCKKYYNLAISNSNDKSTVYNYALDLIKLKEYNDALTHLKSLINDSGTIPLERIYFNIGKCYHEGICIYKSIKYYKKAIEINKNDLKAHTNLGNVYKSFGLYNDALFHYEYVLSKNSEFPEALLNITDLYKKMGNYKLFDKFSFKIKNIQDAPFTQYYEGLILRETDLLRYLTSMDNATSDYTYQIPALIQLFEFHLGNKNISEANTKFEEIFELTKKDIDTGIILCILYNQYGFSEEAIAKLDYIYDNSDDTEEILFEKSILLKDTDLQKAIKICKELLIKDIDNEFRSRIYVNLGNFYSKINDNVSIDYYLKAINSNPNNLVALKNLAIYHANNTEYFFAEDYVDKGLNIEKYNYDLLLIKANLCRDQFRYDDAIKYYDKCLKLNPTSEVYSYIGACFGLIQKFEITLFYLELANNLNYDGHFDLGLFSLYLPVLIALEYIDEDYLLLLNLQQS